MTTDVLEILQLLPPLSFVDGKKHFLDAPVGAIHRGIPGYTPIYTPLTADELNAEHGVTPEQANAMFHGSMFGWHTPSADPRSKINQQ